MSLKMLRRDQMDALLNLPSVHAINAVPGLAPHFRIDEHTELIGDGATLYHLARPTMITTELYILNYTIGWCQGTYVWTAWQRKGLYSQLVKVRDALAAALNLECLMCKIRLDNPIMTKLATYYGWKPTHSTKDYTIWLKECE